MFVEKIIIKDYRCFKDENIVKFAIPKKTEGSGITYLIGANNSGKTTALEALKMRSSENNNIFAARTSDILSNNFAITTISDQNETLRKLKQLRNGSYQIVDSASDEIKNKYIESQPVFVPSKRSWSSRAYNFSNFEDARRNNLYSEVAMRTTYEQRDEQRITALFMGIENEDEKYKEFNYVLQSIFPEYKEFGVRNEDSLRLIYRTINGIEHDTNFLGDGISSVMVIVAHLISYAHKNPIVIDEPELSLHPTAQKRLLEVLSRYSKDTQIIISTHSPYMIDWNVFNGGATINHFVRKNDESCIYNLDNYEKYKALLKAGNWQQPYVTDIVSKEIFFMDNILFVEGQDDMGLLTKAAKLSMTINIFGYGVRGYGNFEFALQLAKDLGIKKAAVIIDNGTKETEIYRNLTKRYPEYKIIQWDRDDIRDKEEYEKKDGEITIKNKKGYFTSKGELKDRKELGDFEEKIRSINEYFENTR